MVQGHLRAIVSEPTGSILRVCLRLGGVADGITDTAAIRPVVAGDYVDVNMHYLLAGGLANVDTDIEPGRVKLLL